MIKFSPSILSVDYNCLEEEIRAARSGGAPWLHIDVMDGIFVPAVACGAAAVRSLRPATDLFFDVHLMVQDPARYIGDFAAAGADLITVHLEACPDTGAALKDIHALGKRAGLAIRPGTPVRDALPWLMDIDLLLIMTVEPGASGQKLIPSCIDKVREARLAAAARKPGLDIEVDGGIQAGNVETVLDAGANVIVAGSAVFAGDPAANTRRFMELFRSRPEGCLECMETGGGVAEDDGAHGFEDRQE